MYLVFCRLQKHFRFYIVSTKRDVIQKLYTTLYGKKIYSLTQQLQRQKVKLANSKNQLIFLEKSITNKIIPKSFQVKSPILSKKGKMLQEEYQMKLLKLARNEAKQRMYKSRSNIVTYLNVLKEQLSKDDYDTLITITDTPKKNIL